jgi:hypothetical protein
VLRDKRLHLVSEAVPTAVVLGLLVNPTNPNAKADTPRTCKRTRKRSGDGGCSADAGTHEPCLTFLTFRMNSEAYRSRMRQHYAEICDRKVGVPRRLHGCLHEN